MMGDFLGYVCVRVDRAKPLSDCVQVTLSRDFGPGVIAALWFDSIRQRIVALSDINMPIEDVLQ